MGIARTQKRKALWPGSLLVALLVALLVTGCAGIKPFEPRDDREEGPEQGLISGAEGEFVIYRKADEPDSDSEASKGSDETADNGK